ncbi:MAG TPA: hypothetical protein VNP72_05700 [Longimicrobium sp.]|nr:hypothetical protein [Longimicrobium sp.]
MADASPALVGAPTLGFEPLPPGGWFPPSPDADAGRAAIAGDLDRAETLYREMQGAAGRIGLAVVAGLRGRHAEALALLRPGDADDGALRVLARANECQALIGVGDMAAAEDAAAHALKAARRLKDEALIAAALFALALAHVARGRRGEARQRLGEALRGFAKAGDVLRQVQCHHLLGDLAYDAEDAVRAGSHYRDGLALARKAGMDEAVELLTLRFEHR